MFSRPRRTWTRTAGLAGSEPASGQPCVRLTASRAGSVTKGPGLPPLRPLSPTSVLGALSDALGTPAEVQLCLCLKRELFLSIFLVPFSLSLPLLLFPVFLPLAASLTNLFSILHRIAQWCWYLLWSVLYFYKHLERRHSFNWSSLKSWEAKTKTGLDLWNLRWILLFHLGWFVSRLGTPPACTVGVLATETFTLLHNNHFLSATTSPFQSSSTINKLKWTTLKIQPVATKCQQVWMIKTPDSTPCMCWQSSESTGQRFECQNQLTELKTLTTLLEFSEQTLQIWPPPINIFGGTQVWKQCPEHTVIYHVVVTFLGIAH